jgi:hypothetical protein
MVFAEVIESVVFFSVSKDSCMITGAIISPGVVSTTGLHKESYVLIE